MYRDIIIKYTATILLILMCIQYIPIEGYNVSIVKVVAMCLTPIVWLIYSPKFSKAFVWCSVYFLSILFSGLFHPETFRLSTVGYQLMFLFMFMTYYNLVYIENAFTLDYFVKLLKGLILAYSICLVLQQIVRLMGFSTLPIINLVSSDIRGFFVANSLALEQSHSARILTALFISLIRTYEIKWGKENITISKLWYDAKYVMMGFVWSMVSMGSGTAIVGLGILSLYFIKRQYILSVLPLIALLYFAAPYLNYEPLQRAKVTLEAAVTLDRVAVIHADHSAAGRVVPLINTINNFDLTDSKFLFGEGVDVNNSGAYLDKDVMIGCIRDYGALSYLLLLVFIFTCCIKLWSLESLIFIVLISANLGNVAYGWAIMMLFAATKYFIGENKKIETEEYESSAYSSR